MSSDKARNLDQLWRLYGVDASLEALEGLLTLSHAKRNHILRHHDDEEITEEAELDFRSELDAVLHAASIIEVGVEAGALEDPSRLVDARLGPILRNAEVQSYYRQRYPLILPAHLLARLAEGLDASPCNEVAWFSSLLSLDARFRDEQLEVFLMLVDGFWIDGVDFQRLRKAARSAPRIVAAITTPPDDRDTTQEALAGLERFVLFSGDLSDQIAAVEKHPSLQTATFLLYRYWYAARESALRDVIRDMFEALAADGDASMAATALAPEQAALEELFGMAQRPTEVDLGAGLSN